MVLHIENNSRGFKLSAVDTSYVSQDVNRQLNKQSNGCFEEVILIVWIECLFQSSTENVMEKRMEEVGGELRKSEAKSSALSKDLQSKEQAVETAQKECAYLKTQLQELERALRDSDQSSRQMEEKLKVLYDGKWGNYRNICNILLCCKI